MPDLAALAASNPYLAAALTPQQPDWRSTLSNALVHMGAGIAGASASGQPWFGGIAPGLSRAYETQQAEAAKQMQQQIMLGHLAMQGQEYQDKRDERDRLQKAAAAWVTSNQPGEAPTGSIAGPPAPGITVPTMPQLGPRASATGPQGDAISKIEGDYGSIGPVADAKGSRGYGKYQVMDYNVGPWTKEALGQELTPQQFLANEKAQDAVFNHKFGQYRQKYGDVGAAKAWFAGEAGMNNPNATDVNGMSVRRYGDKFVANGGAAAAPGGAGPTLSSLPPFEGPGMGDPQFQPGALPPGVDPKVNMPVVPSAPPLPPFMGPGMPSPGFPSASAPQPNVVQGDSLTPTPVQFTPSQAPALQPPPEPPQIPRPALPREEANYLNNMVMTRQMTPKEAEAEKNRRINELWSDQKTVAREKWTQQREDYRFNRGEANKTDRWELVKPEEALALGLPPNVQFQRNKSGELKPVRDTKETNKDISAQFSGPEVEALVADMPPADRAAYKAQVALGDQKGASASLRAQQQKIPPALADVHGDEFLKTRSKEEQNITKALVEGRLLPSDLSKRNDQFNHYINLAQQTSPDYTPNDAGARRAFETKYMVTGLGGQTMQAANTVMPHLETWLKAQAALRNGDSPGINAFVNAAKKQFGDASVSSAEVASQLYGTEVAKAIRGAGPLNEKEELAAKAMTDGKVLSDAQAKGVAKTLTEMMMGRVHVLQETGRMHGIPEEKVDSYMLPSSRAVADKVMKGDFNFGGSGASEIPPPPSGFRLLTGKGGMTPIPPPPGFAVQP